MKVGIVTYHNAVNYGAAFQAYATQEAICNMGVEGEIIDYVNSHRRDSYGIISLICREFRGGRVLAAAKVLAGAPLIGIRTRRFNQFYRKHFKLSQEKYFSAERLKAVPPVYDYYLVGSDQVWNYRHNGSDMNYLLDFVPDKQKTISYASSFGLAEIAEELKHDYAHLLGSIKSLSVRESVGADIVKSLTDRTVPVVLDPVFLLRKREWEAIADEKTGVREPYILLYTTKTAYYEDFLHVTDYNVKGTQLAHLTTSTRLKDIFEPNTKIVFAASPEQFLGLVKNAKLVLTSSFHGMVLSIIFQKKFLSFLASNPGKDARIIGLLEMLGLRDRIFNGKMTAEQVDKPIDYQAVQEKLDYFREKSIHFLRKALDLSVGEKTGG